MRRGLRVIAADRIIVDNQAYVGVTLANASQAPVGAGGLRMIAHRTQGSSIAFSASNHWPLAPDTSVFLTAILPNEILKHVDIVDYIAFDGTVHALGDRLSIGWLSNRLKRGTTGADVQA